MSAFFRPLFRYSIALPVIAGWAIASGLLVPTTAQPLPTDTLSQPLISQAESNEPDGAGTREGDTDSANTDSTIVDDTTESPPISEPTHPDAESPDSHNSPSSDPPPTDEPEEASERTDTAPPNDRSWQRVRRRGRLLVALDPSIGPAYLSVNPDTRRYEGFEWDILSAIAADLNLQLEPVLIPWGGQLETLQTRPTNIDLVWGGREIDGIDTSLYSATTPYYQSPQVIVVRTDLDPPITALTDLFGRKVGIVSNSTGAAFMETLNSSREGTVRLFASSNPVRLLEQLRQEQLDAVAIDRPVAVAAIAGTLTQSGSSPLAEVPDTLDRTPSDTAPSTDSPQAIPFKIAAEPFFPTPLVGVLRASDVTLQQAVNEAIARLERDGTLATILEKWQL